MKCGSYLKFLMVGETSRNDVYSARFTLDRMNGSDRSLGASADSASQANPGPNSAVNTGTSIQSSSSPLASAPPSQLGPPPLVQMNRTGPISVGSVTGGDLQTSSAWFDAPDFLVALVSAIVLCAFLV
jgi:hypothetical protein